MKDRFTAHKTEEFFERLGLGCLYGEQVRRSVLYPCLDRLGFIWSSLITGALCFDSARPGCPKLSWHRRRLSYQKDRQTVGMRVVQARDRPPRPVRTRGGLEMYASRRRHSIGLATSHGMPPADPCSFSPTQFHYAHCSPPPPSRPPYAQPTRHN